MQPLTDESNETGFYIYNITIKVDHGMHAAWIAWMKNEHIPGVMHTGCFVRYRLVHLLETDESDGITYAVQYDAANKADYQSYMTHFAPLLQREMADRWGGHVVGFHSLMEVVH